MEDDVMVVFLRRLYVREPQLIGAPMNGFFGPHEGGAVVGILRDSFVPSRGALRAVRGPWDIGFSNHLRPVAVAGHLSELV
eukprot:11728803-Heterocapsa_arctica.AAC.1